jgi:hypothetical protein
MCTLKLDRCHTERLRKRDNLLTGGGEWGGGGANSYDSEKDWSSISNLILWVQHTIFFGALYIVSLSEG